MLSISYEYLYICVAITVPTNHTLIFENYEKDLESDPSASLILSRNFEKSYLQMAAGWKGWLDRHMPNCKRKEKFKERVDLVVLSTKGILFQRGTQGFWYDMVSNITAQLNYWITFLHRVALAPG